MVAKYNLFQGGWAVVGITSFGVECARDDFPGSVSTIDIRPKDRSEYRNRVIRMSYIFKGVTENKRLSLDD